MTATLGVPPMPSAKFTWDYYDKDGKVSTWEGTPKQFYKVLTLNRLIVLSVGAYASAQEFANSKQYPVADSFSLINDPRNEYTKIYTVDKLGNVWGGRPVLCVYLFLSYSLLG